MKFNLPLTQKALLLIAVPLAFELIFVCALVLQLNKLEVQYKAESQSRDVLMSVNNELKGLLEAAGAIGMYQVNRENRFMNQFRADLEQLKTSRLHLAELISKDQGEDLRIYDKVLEQVVTTLEQSENLALTGDKIDSMRAIIKIRKLLKDMEESGSKVIDRQERIHEEERMAQASLRESIKIIIIAGVAISILIALWLARSVNQGTSRRLDVLMNNTLMLAMERPLEPPLEGNDEIAIIDGVFHKMADVLANARRKEAAMTENALDVICSLDDKARFTKMNQAVKNVWGYDDDDLLGRSILSLIDQADAERTRLAIEEVVSGKSTEKLEIRMRRKDSTMCDMLWSAQWSATEQSVFCVARDISERKRLERMKQEVVAMVSHDLRSPLTAIQAMFELLEGGMLGELNISGKDKLARSNAVLNRLISMINDLLDMERLESGVFELDCKPVPFATIAAHSLEAVQLSADKKKIKILVADSDLDLFCDGDRIVRVLVNFLGNAIKFSPAGKTIKLEVTQLDDYLEVGVQDEGPGIPPDKVETIFERFKQIDRSDETEKGGSGLGLAICKAIIDAHHGLIGVGSELGQGSKFWFKLPRTSLENK